MTVKSKSGYFAHHIRGQFRDEETGEALWHRKRPDFSGNSSRQNATQAADLQRNSLLIVGRHADVQASEHLRQFSSLASTWSDLAFGKACLAAISQRHPTMAAGDPFRPGRIQHTPVRSSVCW
jgi:hypothetical protein